MGEGRVTLLMSGSPRLAESRLGVHRPSHRTPRRGRVRRRTGKGRSQSTHKCVCNESEIPAAQGAARSPRVEPAQGDAGDCRNIFTWDRKAAAAVTNCRVWLQSCVLIPCSGRVHFSCAHLAGSLPGLCQYALGLTNYCRCFQAPVVLFSC